MFQYRILINGFEQEMNDIRGLCIEFYIYYKQYKAIYFIYSFIQYRNRKWERDGYNIIYEYKINISLIVISGLSFHSLLSTDLIRCL